MERSEPSLIPQWLKGPISNSSNNNVSSSSTLSNLNHHFPSSSHSDELLTSQSPRNRNSGREQNGSRSLLSSSSFRRGSRANGSSTEKDGSRAYSSFGRSRHHRDSDRERDLDCRERERPSRLYFGDYPDVVTHRGEKETLRRSRSMVSGRSGNGELLSRRSVDSSGNGFLGGGVHKGLSERDFPSLGADEKQVGSEINRVASPRVAASLPMGSSAVIGGEGWTSALANLPGVIGGSNGSSQPPAPSTPTGLNMAETLVQAPLRTRVAPQVSSETQRLEELALKQSRQLIPVTPSMPKTSALSTSDKLKPKPARSNELAAATKVGQQVSSQPASHNPRVSARSDVSKTSQVGKLVVLNPPKEKNGIILATKDTQTSASGPANNTVGVMSSTQFASLRSPNSPAMPVPADRKGVALSTTQNSTVPDKKAISQAQERNEFFKSLRKRNSTNHSPMVSVSEKPDQDVTGVDAGVVSKVKSDDASVVASGESCCIENGSSEELPCPDPNEEEAAFLKSLGWEANNRETALTQEEICEFLKKSKDRLPPKWKSQVSCSVGISVGLSSDSETEA
ncbi:hypothetical protein QJS10_CPB19g01813 [Acorus calamus]|uniref:Uncharacterized protein n=1 Tax=Acorus calamus TaxID=4465 RepID=A0AAV9CI62_ACOCL|nr:hypothetical protein QJS10_CPB19g01813 [Acorus calamus]